MDTAASTPGRRYVMLMRNKQEQSIQLILEPRGAEFEMPPGAGIEVRVEGPEGDPMEIDYQPDAIIVWGWTGAIMTAYQDGVPLERYTDTFPQPIPFLYFNPPKTSE